MQVDRDWASVAAEEIEKILPEGFWDTEQFANIIREKYSKYAYDEFGFERGLLMEKIEELESENQRLRSKCS